MNRPPRREGGAFAPGKESLAAGTGEGSSGTARRDGWRAIHLHIPGGVQPGQGDRGGSEGRRRSVEVDSQPTGRLRRPRLDERRSSISGSSKGSRRLPRGFRGDLYGIASRPSQGGRACVQNTVGTELWTSSRRAKIPGGYLRPEEGGFLTLNRQGACGAGRLPALRLPSGVSARCWEGSCFPSGPGCCHPGGSEAVFSVLPPGPHRAVGLSPPELVVAPVTPLHPDNRLRNCFGEEEGSPLPDTPSGGRCVHFSTLWGEDQSPGEPWRTSPFRDGPFRDGILPVLRPGLFHLGGANPREA